MLWIDGPWELPNSAKGKGSPLIAADTTEGKGPPLAGTEIIISKNLFDPERGEGMNREAETNSRAFQRIRGMILLGTAILGGNRYAVLRDQSQVAIPGQVAPNQPQNPMRLKLGDDFEGFKLTDIGEKRVVFSKGASRVEVALDYFRKAEPAPSKAPAPTQARRIERGVQPTPVPAPGQVPANPAPAPGQVAPSSPVAPRVIPNLPRRERIPVPQQKQPDETEE